MKTTRRWLSGLAVAAIPLLVVTLGWAQDNAEPLEILIKDLDFKFENTSLKDQIIVLPTGMEVSFMNVDPLITTSGLEGLMPHFLFINDQDGKEVARSQIMTTKDQATFNYTFIQPGSYVYGCLIHNFMRGKVLVFNIQTAALQSERHAAAH